MCRLSNGGKNPMGSCFFLNWDQIVRSRHLTTDLSFPIIFSVIFLVGFVVPQAFAQSVAQASDPSILDDILARIYHFLSGVTGSANITPSSNPAGISSQQLQHLEGSGYNVASKSLDLGKAVNNATVTTINDFSPIHFPSWLLWLIGIGITFAIVIGFLKKFWRHFLYFVGVVIAVSILLLLIGINAKVV